MNTNAPLRRCAVYTRKSTDEGLDQVFNSLDAQREACVAHIASQAGLGWALVPISYDDGGISGGTMQRPALQRLLEDIGQRRIDIVVVYKIDRLTRSLVDFSKIVEIFDAADASFVSVTQQFNTTTSMGRLTLNVLLSFAQFEREVAAERVRDKIAASKRKGLWMGGTVPLGYRAENRKLVIEEAEAKTVRLLFDRYLDLKSVRALAEEAAATKLRGRTTKGPQGAIPGKPFGRGNLYHLLSNPVYIGKVRHRDLVHDGEHQPIIDPPVFAKAKALLKVQAPRRSAHQNTPDSHLLTGLVFDETGDRLSPTHARKNGKRYRYYVSSRLIGARKKGSDGWRIPASQLKSLVEGQLNQIFSDKIRLADWLRNSGDAHQIDIAFEEADRICARLEFSSAIETRKLLMAVFPRIQLTDASLELDTDCAAVVGMITSVSAGQPSERSADKLHPVRVRVPIALQRRGVEMRLAVGSTALASPDPALISLIARAHYYLKKLTDGTMKTLTEVAAECGTGLSEVSRTLPLAFLSPTIVETAMTATQRPSLTAQRLLRCSDLPPLWSDQTELFSRME